MRVLVELFDKEPIENILGTCIFEPEIVVFICDQRDSSLVKESAVYRLLRHRKLKTQPRFYYLDATDITEITRVLDAVHHDYPGCIFDFTGGTDLILLVAGAFCKAKNIPGYYIDFENQRFINVQKCSHLIERFRMPVFSAEDVFVITGATIHGYGHFEPKELNSELEQDASRVWNIVSQNPKAWGSFVGWLQASCSRTSSLALQVCGTQEMKSGTNGGRYNRVVARHLRDVGILTFLQEHGQTVELEFKNLVLKKSLQNQGIWLELYCYNTAKNTGYFDDVRTSIVIDWDGVDGGPDSTKNEVDVFLVKGMTPVFISCKMSIPVPLALSEIKILSIKFGGRHSRTVLVTGGTLGAEHRALRARAADLEVHLLDDSVIRSGKLGDELIRISQTNRML